MRFDKWLSFVRRYGFKDSVVSKNYVYISTRSGEAKLLQAKTHSLSKKAMEESQEFFFFFFF